jgi:uncharacterized membrane protein
MQMLSSNMAFSSGMEMVWRMLDHWQRIVSNGSLISAMQMLSSVIVISPVSPEFRLVNHLEHCVKRGADYGNSDAEIHSEAWFVASRTEAVT